MTKLILRGVLITLLLAGVALADDKIRVLLIDGQNNHAAWPRTTPMIKQTLENCRLFEVTHSRTPPRENRARGAARAQPAARDTSRELQAQWAKWRPDFSQFDVVVSNYNGIVWPDSVREDFETFMSEGGGLVVVHAADNSFPQWKEYNRMIGVGGWYGRNEKDGPAIYWEDGRLMRDESEGRGGAHGRKVEVLVQNRAPDHPITRGMPPKWMHPSDEVYYNMRGPAENITVLATALSDRTQGGSGRHQPILLALTYGKGRIFHDMLGHDERAFKGVGFQSTLQRGTEWAATGKVTLPPVSVEELPADHVATRDPSD